MADSANNNGTGTSLPDAENKNRKLTVMCFFGSDNPLSPLLISQVKAIKDAGWEQDTDVLVRFDPQEACAPTRVYHVNNRRRAVGPKFQGKRTQIGDGADPYVRNMAEDIIDPRKIVTADDKPMSKAMKDELTQDAEVSAFDSLQNFVGFCRETYPAKHYLLFLIGHGMIVGNDAFLPDANPNSGVSLAQLTDVLAPFKKGDRSTLELLGLHSCSMSSVEIAYQLKGLANYMIASQGTSFVGSWPYRQLLKKVFFTAHKATGEINIQEMVEKLYSLSLYNSSDFMLAGYSSDMSLCNLQPEAVDQLTGPLQRLIDLLTKALATGREITDPVRDVILGLIGKAHYESQSYWGESYTDLYDFCGCLADACDSVNKLTTNDTLKRIAEASRGVMATLETASPIGPSEGSERFRRLVVRSEYFGWKFQHSHGLSIYFPWSEPLAVENVTEIPVAITPQPGQELSRKGENEAPQSIMDRYEAYAFNQAFRKTGSSWCSFLNSYFDVTQRSLRNGTPPKEVQEMLQAGPAEAAAMGHTAVSSFLEIGDHKSSSETGVSPGGDCGCSSIKNFHTQADGRGRKIRAFSISPGALRAFRKPVPPAADDAADVNQSAVVVQQSAAG